MAARDGITIYGTDEDDLFISFSEEKKREILNSLNIKIGTNTANQLMFLTEYCLEATWNRYFYAHDRVDYSRSLDHIKRIRKNIENILAELHYISEYYEEDMFWSTVIANKHRNVTPFRWKIYVRMYSDLFRAYNFFGNYIEKKRVSYVNTDFGNKELDQETAVNDTLYELAKIYFTIIGKKPGRSKSTIGPFVRYAYIVLSELPLYKIKSIDSLNDRWANSKVQPRKIKLEIDFAREYAAKKGVIFPF